MWSRSFILVILSTATQAAAAVAQEVEGTCEATSATWRTVVSPALPWLPILIFVLVWVWWWRKWRSNFQGGYFNYLKIARDQMERSRDHMDKVEQKLDAIRELLERNQRAS